MKAKEAQYLKGVRERNRGRKHIRVSESLLDWDPSRIEQELNPGTSNKRLVKALRHILDTVIEQELTPRQRKDIQMYYYDGLTLREIAEKRSVSITTVARSLYSGKAKIRRSLKYCLLLLRTSIEVEEDDDDD